MPLAVYMDQHVPRAITNGLRLRQIDVLTAAEDGASEEIIATAGEPDDLRQEVLFLPL